MRICFFTGGLHLGGIGKLSVVLAREFLKKGVKVDFFLLKGGGEYTEQVPDKARIFIAEGNSIKQIFKYVIYLSKEKPDISISARQRQDLVSILCGLFSLSKTKPVISIHTNLSRELDQVKNRKNVFPLLAKWLYKVPEKFIAVSKGVADDFSQRTGVKRKKVKVIHNPAFTASQDNSPRAFEPEFRQLQKKSKRFIISVGRFTEAKDLPTLIKAFSIVKKQMDVSLVLLGDGPKRKEIEDLIKKMSLADEVLLLGYLNNPQDYMQAASVLVLSSKWEGFGNVLVEAMGVGTPVVSTDCPSGPAEILQDGKYGKLVPVGNPQKLAQAIINTLQKPVETKLLKKRAQDFSATKIAEEYLEYISS